jgi:hypothetical protein
MAYEIPSALRYQEKVAFGLTFKQLAYLGAAGALSAIVFFKAPFAIELKAIVMVVALAAAGAAAFLDADTKLLEVLRYLSGAREVGYLDPRALRLMRVRAVEGDAILMADGTRLAVLNCTPLNLSVKSEAEREDITTNFREFLNSLSFSVQICIRTVDSLKELREYFDRLEKSVKRKATKGNADALAMMQEHRKFFEDYVQENAVKNRLFYIVVPQQSGRDEKALKELAIKVEVTREKLASTGIPSARLNTNRLISLLSSYFEEFVEVDRDYLFPLSMARGERHA